MKNIKLLIVALLGTTLSAFAQCPDNEVWYSTVDGMKIELGNIRGISSHTFADSNGVIRFDHDIEIISTERGESGDTNIYFTDCANLKSITLPDSVTEVGDRAFAGCVNLQTITLPNEVVKIGNEAFDGCTSLQSVIIPAGLEYIGGRAFHNCTSLQSITLPDGIEYIRDGAFEGCSSLKTFISQYASEDGNALIVNGTLTAFALGSGVAEYIIPEEVTRIGRATFDGYTALRNIVIPATVTEIRGNAFRGCTLLKGILTNGCHALRKNDACE